MRARTVTAWVVLVAALTGWTAARAQRSEPGSHPAPDDRARAEAEAQTLNAEGEQLYGQGKIAEALKKLEQALVLRQKLYPPRDYPQGHPNLATSLSNLGLVLLAMGEYGKSLPYNEQALAMNERLYPQARFPQGHPELANSLNNLGGLYWVMGAYGKALPYFEQALAMQQRLFPEARFPQGHPQLATTLNNLGALVKDKGDFARALSYFEQATAMFQKLYPAARFPQGHPQLAQSLNNLGYLLGAMGEHGKALPYLEQALAMRQRLYPEMRFPQGHPHLAESLNNLGALLYGMGEYARGQPYLEQTVAMFQKLYPEARFPQGHPDLASGLFNLGGLLLSMGEYGKALPYLEQALAMRQRLYSPARFPEGHPLLALSLNSLGSLQWAQGQYGKALPYYEQALAMCQRLYPQAGYPLGHPQLAQSLSSLGYLLWALGQSDKALPHYEQALVMDRRLAASFTANAPEAEALSFLRTLPLTRDGYLTAALAANVPAAANYAHVWASKAPLTRLLQRRHQATRLALAGSEAARLKWQDLLDTRRNLARLLLEPATNQQARDQKLARLTDHKEALERELAGQLPETARAKQVDQLGPTDLAAMLPKGAAFIDLLRYTHVAKDRQRSAKYLAFLVLPDKSIKQVELGDAQAIDQAVTAWRRAIEALKDTPADAARVARLVWQPLARELPAGTATVYLAPDGELARVPWAALPGNKPGTVLLEDLALAVVPHGPFLLEQLKEPPRYPGGKETVLALGAVDYGPPTKGGYGDLPATSAEIRQVSALAGGRATVVLEKDQATWTHLQEALPKARYAHLATHGFFHARGLLEENRRIEQQRKAWQEGGITERVGLGMRSPLSYTGLVLAGANQAAEGAIITGEALVELPLEGLRLCVLSACQTGLGDLGPLAGEGVQGLQRAFHLAGCPNVVASLWNVNDQATAALMAKFYHGLWHENKTPLEVLRQAQLTIYRHPERIARLADRAAPDFNDTIRLTPAGQGTRAPTKLWAAFVLSGVGQ
jgi:CHAT domain-containing protein/tetratricopeptide (TPR) repeat protein